MVWASPFHPEPGLRRPKKWWNQREPTPLLCMATLILISLNTGRNLVQKERINSFVFPRKASLSRKTLQKYEKKRRTKNFSSCFCVFFVFHTAWTVSSQPLSSLGGDGGTRPPPNLPEGRLYKKQGYTLPLGGDRDGPSATRKRNKNMEPPSFSFEKLQKKQRFLLECSHFWELNCTFAISLQHPCKYSLTIKI